MNDAQLHEVRDVLTLIVHRWRDVVDAHMQTLKTPEQREMLKRALHQKYGFDKDEIPHQYE